MNHAYSPECETCTRCHNAGCRNTVCLSEDPAALCDDCGAVTCDGCEHDCPEAETRAVLDALVGPHGGCEYHCDECSEPPC